jgi:hypothetical protein
MSKIKVLKSYSTVPTNPNTLFLRNLEKILTNHGVMCECQTKTFRNNTCHEILYLIENYLSDRKNDGNELLMSQYKVDSMWTRFDDDRRKLSVNHSHQ